MIKRMRDTHSVSADHTGENTRWGKIRWTIRSVKEERRRDALLMRPFRQTCTACSLSVTFSCALSSTWISPPQSSCTACPSLVFAPQRAAFFFLGAAFFFGAAFFLFGAAFFFLLGAAFFLVLLTAMPPSFQGSGWGERTHERVIFIIPTRISISN